MHLVVPSVWDIWKMSVCLCVGGGVCGFVCEWVWTRCSLLITWHTPVLSCFLVFQGFISVIPPQPIPLCLHRQLRCLVQFSLGSQTEMYGSLKGLSGGGPRQPSATVKTRRRKRWGGLRQKWKMLGLFPIDPEHEFHGLTCMMKDGLAAAIQSTVDTPPTVSRGPPVRHHMCSSLKAAGGIEIEG